MKTYYFTFGSGQKYENGYYVIQADDWLKARLKMIEKFEREWSCQYSDEDSTCSPWTTEGITQAKQYDLFRVY